jgi:4-hydroxy-tetrahydrodipicolinate synthase
VNPSSLSGSIVAIVTPFLADGSIDLPAFLGLVDRQLAAGTHGIVVAGSTGESAALDDGEFEILLTAAVARVAGRIPVIAGCGAAATHKALKQMRRARSIGADAALVVTPYYARPTQEGLYRHYLELADQGGLPLITYNVPGRTGCDLLPATVARLNNHPAIVGIKEARSEPERMEDLLKLQHAGFVVLSGDDPTALRALRAGARGVISVAANVAPAAFARLCALALSGDTRGAAAQDAALRPLYEACGIESNPIPAKWMLERFGLIGPTLRLPLTRLAEQFHASVGAVADTIAGLEAAATSSKPS